MSGQLLYLLGTVANWTGWIALAYSVYRGVDVLMKPPGLARGPGVKQFVSSAITCAVGFLIANTLPMNSGMKVEGLKLPIVWPVLPFAAWATVVLVCFAAIRSVQVAMEVDQRKTSFLLASFLSYLGAGYLFFWRTEHKIGISPSLAAWGSILLLGLSALLASILLIDLSADSPSELPAVLAQRRARLRQALFAQVLAWIFLLFFMNSGDSATIVKGVIPFSVRTALSIVLLAIVALILMAVAAQSSRRRGVAKQVVLHVVLLIGCVVFGIPFLWLIVTSFKEPLDMSSANGIVWIPKVSETVPYRDPKFPYYQGKVNGVTVQADVIERLPDGKLRLNVAHPMSMQGATFVAAPNEIQEIDRQVPVVTGTYKGQQIQGEQIKTTDNGQYVILVTSPPDSKGTTYTANPSEVQPVRHVGLKFANYPDSLDYLPTEANKGLVYLQNTLILVVLNVIGTLLSSAIVAYGFSRLRFPGRNLFFGVLVATMMLPAAVTLLPTFLIFRTLGMIDTLYPLWLPAFFASAFNVFLLRQFFMTIPNELEDASKIDGCNYFKTFWKIMLPQVKPALAVVAIFSFMGVWNNFQGPLVYINSPEHMPISYALQLYNGDHNTEPGLLMAFTVMTMLPVLALFFFAQRYFIEGVTLSGLGGR